MIKFYMRKNRERENVGTIGGNSHHFAGFWKTWSKGEKSKSNFFTKVAFTKILIGISF